MVAAPESKYEREIHFSLYDLAYYCKPIKKTKKFKKLFRIELNSLQFYILEAKLGGKPELEATVPPEAPHCSERH